MDNETEERFKDVIYEIRIVNGLVVFNMIILGAILLTGLVLMSFV
jgi:hypothetical protein